MDIFTALFVFIFFGLPVLLTGINFYRMFAEKSLQSIWYDIITIFWGMICTSLDLGIKLREGVSYDAPVYVGEYHLILSEPQLLSFILPSAAGLLCLLILAWKNREHRPPKPRKWRMRIVGENPREPKPFKPFPPLVGAFLVGGVLVGSIFHILFCIQLANHIDDFMIAFAILYFINLLMLAVRAIRAEIRNQVAFLKEHRSVPKGKRMQKLYELLSHSVNWLWLGFAAILPVLAVLYIVLLLCGQTPSDAVKVFTETADWTFSQHIPPPPAVYEGHYLCTVAAGGHRRIVKPLRLGIRQNTRIIVNRQLCVANAFEDLIMERAPKLHRCIRNFYDTHGYPLSKKIDTKGKADVVYLLMKPLEWFFLLVLYTFDRTPEDRIAIQYTGKRVNSIG